MKVAVISFDIKYVEMLKQNLSGVEVIPYSDTISFLKEIETHKPDMIVYDTTSGIFAEDDLKYLLTKNIVEDKKIFGLTSPDNYIDTNLFEGKVIFFDKTGDLQNLVSTILSFVSETKKDESKVENLQQQELEIGKIDSEMEDFTEKEHIDSAFMEFENLTETPESISIKEPSLELESFDTTYEIDTFSNENFENLSEELVAKSDLMEPSTYQEPLEIEEIPINLEVSYDLTPESEILETTQQDQHVYSFEDIMLSQESENVEQHQDISVENKLTSESEILETTPELVKQDKHDYSITEEISEIKEKDKYEVQKDVEGSEERIKFGGEGMVANFNFQISEDEIKALALTVAREFLEKDPSMEKIVDYLQIDFQDEARRELDNIKNDLKEQLRIEAEVMMKQEIERLIKEELKDYVADITARIVKEKLEQIFKSS